MGHCRDCKFWVPPDLDKRHADALDRVYGQCPLGASTDDKPEMHDALMFARDTEGRQAWMCTKPDFGCVMFQAKVVE